MASPAVQRLSALAMLRRSEQVLLVGLVGVGVARAAGEAPERTLVLAGAGLALVGWYAAGAVVASNRSAGPAAATGWLVALTLGWVALVWLSTDFLWSVLALFLIYLRMLAMRTAVAAIVGLAAVAIAAVAVREGGLSLPVVVGPLIGAAVAIVITLVNRDLREAAQRSETLVRELTAAQESLTAAERQAGTLAERERLAREIHDTVGQSLTSILLLLRAARAQGDRLPATVDEQLEAAELAAKASLEDTRRLVRALTPADLAGQSLPDALKRLTEAAGPVGVDVRFHLEGTAYELPTPLAVALLRTAQGALGNVVRHSGARRTQVTLTFLPEQVRLDVSDDGVGFDLAAAAVPIGGGTGIGLAAMRHRLSEVGGSLTVESTPGGGTAVSATVPTEEPDV